MGLQNYLEAFFMEAGYRVPHNLLNFFLDFQPANQNEK
jgi:hypothetical protein